MTTNRMILSLLMLIAACSQNDNKKLVASNNVTDNHLYFLSIGNAHYVKDESGKIDIFTNVSGANTSADYFFNFLSCYGKGILVKSDKDRLLSKKMLSLYLDSVINTAIKDSLSTTFIYYCGHGFSDGVGNVYLIPGNHKYDKSLSSLTSLLSIDDIQQKIIDATGNTYKSDKPFLYDPGVKKEIADFKAYLGKNENSQDHTVMESFLQKISEALKRYYLALQRPRFVIMADCCTEDIKEVNLSQFINTNLKKDYASMNNKLGGETLSMLQVMMYNTSVQATKGKMCSMGNRTIYTAEIGKLARMVTSPVDTTELIGPICRRLALFFRNNNNSFNLSQLLTKLGNEKFDSLSTAPMFEDGRSTYANTINTTDMISNPELPKYKTTINTNLQLEKKDSISYNCNKLK